MIRRRVKESVISITSIIGIYISCESPKAQLIVCLVKEQHSGSKGDCYSLNEQFSYELGFREVIRS
jgi:hypothetical protein